MKKGIIGLLLAGSIATIANAQVSIGKTYIIPPEDKEGTDMLNRLDMTGAENGDTPSMARVANHCLKAGDYACAYKWSALSLGGTVMWMNGVPHEILKIRDVAVDNLTIDQKKETMKEIAEYMKQKFEKSGTKTPPDNTKNLSIKELKALAQKGKIPAAGNLAKKCLEIKDYECTFKWATLAGMGSLWYAYNTEILAWRDVARKQLPTQKQSYIEREMNYTFRRWLH